MPRLTSPSQDNPKLGRSPHLFYRGMGWMTTIVGLGLISGMGTPVWANIQTIRPDPLSISQNLAQAAVIYVDPSAGIDSAASTGSQAGPYRSISYALQKAEPGTVIQLNPGTYSPETGEVFPILLKDGVPRRRACAARPCS